MGLAPWLVRIFCINLSVLLVRLVLSRPAVVSLASWGRRARSLSVIVRLIASQVVLLRFRLARRAVVCYTVHVSILGRRPCYALVGDPPAGVSSVCISSPLSLASVLRAVRLVTGRQAMRCGYVFFL